MVYYLSLFSPETWAVSWSTGCRVTGFRQHQQTRAEQVEPGDVFLCYMVGLSRWCGALRVTSRAYDDGTPYFSDPDPLTVRFEVEPLVALGREEGIPILLDSLWHHLSATREHSKGNRNWGSWFRASLRVVPDRDGRLIVEHLEKQKAQPIDYPFSDLRPTERSCDAPPWREVPYRAVPMDGALSR